MSARQHGPLQRQVKAKGLVEIGEKFDSHKADAGPDTFCCYGSDLLGLGLGVDRQARVLRWEQNLEWIDAISIRRHRNDGDDAAAEAFGDAVGSIVAHNHCRPLLVRLGSSNRVEIDEPNLAAAHSAQTVSSG